MYGVQAMTVAVEYSRTAALVSPLKSRGFGHPPLGRRPQTGRRTVVSDGTTYYLFDGVYYQAYLYGGQTVRRVPGKKGR